LYRIHRLRRFQTRLSSPPEIFTPDAYGTKNWRLNPAPENELDLYGAASGACVMGIIKQVVGLTITYRLS